MSLTRAQLEEGLMLFDQRYNSRKKPGVQWHEWEFKHMGDLLRMALDSLPKGIGVSKDLIGPRECSALKVPTGAALVWQDEESSMKEAIESLRGFAPDFPQEPKPEPACCGNCRHFVKTDVNEFEGFCDALKLYCFQEYGWKCSSHERKNANT